MPQRKQVGNKKARDFMRQQHEAAEWERVRGEVRAAASDVFAPGIGARRMQLIVCPSFEESMAWEVRQRQDVWRVFRSRVVAPWPAVQLVGYDPVAIDAAVLSSFFARLTAQSLPLAPDLSGMGGCDGTVTQLAVSGDLFSGWRFQWWSHPPAQWQPLTALASEMITAFSEAGNSG